jgi:hypothetical protein
MVPSQIDPVRLCRPQTLDDPAGLCITHQTDAAGSRWARWLYLPFAAGVAIVLPRELRRFTGRLPVCRPVHCRGAIA